MRAIDISAETANGLRELILKSQETCSAFEETQKKMKKRYLELAGPVENDEIAAFCKDTDCSDSHVIERDRPPFISGIEKFRSIRSERAPWPLPSPPRHFLSLRRM